MKIKNVSILFTYLYYVYCMNVNVMSDMKKNIISLYLLTNFFRATERRIYAYMRVR